MLRALRLSILLASTCTLSAQALPPIGASGQPARVALVIGNQAYGEGSLKNPVNDAQAIKEALESCRFQVTLLTDADKRAMEGAIATFGERIRNAGVGLFYFAGHGIQLKGENYLVPIGARLDQEADVAYSGVNVGQVLDRMESARASLNVVILDACRNNPFQRSWHRGAGDRGLALVSAPSGSLVAYATAPGATAADGDGEHGLYTGALLGELRVPGVKLLDLFQNVRARVKDASRGQQIPWESNSTLGDFYFRPLAVQPGGPAQPAGPTQAEQEAAYWESLQGSRDSKEFEAFLARFPGGAHAELAGLKLMALRSASIPVVVVDLAEPWKALVKDTFETDPEFATRIAGMPWVPVGRVKVDKAGYDVQTRRFTVSMELAEWARKLMTRRRLVLDLDRDQARDLVAAGASHPLAAHFEVRNGQPAVAALAVNAPSGALTLDLARERPPVQPGPGQVWHDPASNLDFCWIPPGRFRMGSPPTEAGRQASEGPQHDVTIAQGFWMGRTPVTRSQYRAVMGDNPSLSKAGGPDSPVDGFGVSEAFHLVMNLRDQSEAVMYDLPTEAQWEYACRAGSSGVRYGSTDAIGWYDGNSGGAPHPVAQKQPNAWGLFDMLGNVWQWCDDYHHEDYTGAPEDGSDWLGGPGDGFMIRGGAYYSPESCLRFAMRGWCASGGGGVPRGVGVRVLCRPR